MSEPEMMADGSGASDVKPSVWYCLICSKPLPDYEPTFCCSGFECGCQGMPTEPWCCSVECERAVFDHIGKPFDERRRLAGIERFEA